MQLQALASMVCSKVGKTDDASVAACKDYLRARHEMIFDAFLWKDAVADPVDVLVEAGSREVILPYDISRPIACWETESGYPLEISNLTAIAIVNPASLSNVGGLMSFVEAESVGWLYSLDVVNGSTLAFINTSPVDATVSIVGQRNLNFAGLPTLPDITHSQSLTVGANGGTVQSPVPWKFIHRMTKPAEIEILVAQLGVIPEKSWAWPADSTEASFARVRLIHPTTDATSISFLGKRRLRQMNLDSDSPMIRGIDNALMAFAHGDMLERGRQYAKAQAKTSEGTMMLDLARKVELEQSASEIRIVPQVFMDEGEDFDRW